MSWQCGTEYLDSLMKDYLKFRRLNSTVKALENELKADKDKGHRVDKVVQQLLVCVHTYDIDGLVSYWQHLKETFFCRFARYQIAAIEKYEADLYRLYMVHAVQNSKPKELQTFFQKVTDMETIPNLKDWYVLLFSNTPETKANFAPYFTRQWSETFVVSLHNLLSAVFSCMPEPDFVQSCIEDGKRIAELEKENERLRAMLAGSAADSEPKYSQHSPSYIGALGRPASLASTGRKASETSSKKTSAGTSKQAAQDSPSSSKSFQSGSSTSSNNAASSTILSSAKITSTTSAQPGKSKETSKLGLFKKSPSLGTSSALNTVTRVGISPNSVSSDDSSVNNNHAQISVYPARPVNAFDDVQRSSSPSEITYSKHLLLGKPQDTVPMDLGTSAGSPSTSRDLPLNFKSSLPGSLRESNPFISTGSLYPEHNTRSPPTYKKEPFLVLSKDIFQEHHSSVVQCKFDNTGTTIASVESQGVVKVWQNEPTIKSLATLVMHNPVQCLEWCCKPTDTLLLGTSNGMIRFFDVAKNTSIRDVTIDDAHCCLTCMRTNPSGTLLVTSSLNPSESKQQSSWPLGILMAWDIASSRINHPRKIVRNSAYSVTCMDYNHNGNLLVTGDISGCMTLFDMKTTAVIHSCQAHDGAVSFVQFSPDETFVFSFGADNELMAWNINYLQKEPVKFDFAKIARQPSTPGSSVQPHLVISPDGNHALVSSGSKGHIYQITTSTQTLKHVLLLPEQKSSLTALDWIASKACGHCLTGSSDGRIQVTTLLMQS